MPETNMTTIERRVFMGIGDAVLRLIHVERMVADGAHPPPPLLAERDLIVTALNQQYQLDLGMDCDLDGIPDSIDNDVNALTHAAQTSCCRIMPETTSTSRTSKSQSRVEPLPDPEVETQPKRSSRKAVPEVKAVPEDKKSETKQKGFFSTFFGTGSDSEEK